ncbi:MAG: AI-2E family transporter [Ruminiclostridium sp.]|nr:AI-2E family transporter [Ruminiclostridium sp.]
MNHDNFPTKRILGIITFGLLLYWGLLHPSQVGAILSGVYALVAPFVLGFAIAFIVNVPLRLLEGQWDKRMKSPKGKRPVCLVASLIIVAGIIFALFFIVVPALTESIGNLTAQLPQYVRQLESLYLSLMELLAQRNIVLPTLDLDLEKIYSTVLNFITNYGEALMDTTIGVTTSIVSVIVNFVLAFVFSLYLLAQKETFMRQGRKVVNALLPQRWANNTLQIATLTNRTFANFVTGQLTEAVILGSLCFLGMTIFRFPYAAVVSVLIGFCALIPIFGAIIGAIVGAFLILLVAPMKALWFLVFLIVLQQLEGNLIYPRVVGKSVGLPGIWVLAAVTVGGNAFGLVGMLVGVPVCSVLYTLFREFVNYRLEQKNITP